MPLNMKITEICGLNVNEVTELHQFIQRQVEYIDQSAAMQKQKGTIIKDRIFTIKEVQRDYKGKLVFRIYFKGDSFGRCALFDELRFVD